MAQLQTHNNSGRKKLVVTKAPEAKQITGKDGKPIDFIEFMAKIEGEDSAVKYSVWSKALNDFFSKLGAVVDCDVVVADQKQLDPDGNPYKNRKVTQVYQDGKPVKEQASGKSWGKSPETVAMEIDGKFRDTALMQACDTVKFNNAKSTITVNEVLIVATEYYAWLKGERPAFKAPEKPAVKETVQPAKQEAALPATASPAGIPADITTGAKLAAYASKHGVTLAKFNSLLQSNPNDIRDIPAAWAILFPDGVK